MELINIITPNLFIASENEIHQIAKNGSANTFLDLRADAYKDYEHAFFESVPYVEYHQHGCYDGNPMPAEFISEAVTYIDSKINETLHKVRPLVVNCQAGISRSPAIAIAYLISKYKSHELAISTVLKKRPMALVHYNVWQSLSAWSEKEGYGALPTHSKAFEQSIYLWDSGYWDGLWGAISESKLGASWVNPFDKQDRRAGQRRYV